MTRGSGRFWLLGVLLLSGCALVPPDQRADFLEQKSLLNWSLDQPDEPEQPEPATRAEADAQEPISADRPDFTEASDVIRTGRVQLEAGYTLIRDNDDGRLTTDDSFPEALFRIGTPVNWMELRIGQNFGSSRSSAGNVVESFRGANDLYLGTKLQLSEQSGPLPESSIVPQMTVPTGHRSFTSDQVLPGVNYLFGWDIVPDRIDFGGSTQVNAALDGTGHQYAVFAQALTAGFAVTEKLGAYVEFFAFFPTGSDDPDVGKEYYFDGGFRYLINNNLQYDIRAGKGLNPTADDYFLGTGFSVRF